MKKTENKLKSKGIKGHDFTHRIKMEYDRNYTAKGGGDVNHLAFSHGSSNDWDGRYNVRLYHYLNRWFKKQLGRKTEAVFRDFSKLGWKTAHDMYAYWDMYVHPANKKWGNHQDVDGNLA